MCEVPKHFGDPVVVQSEHDLYQPLENYVLQGFYAEHKPKYGSMLAVAAQTALIPSAEGGTWTQPDVAAVLISRSKFATTAEIRLFSFEVKTMMGCQLQSVHEALAHTRFVNFSYLVWNRPKCICGDPELFATIKTNCAAYGVGLITVHDPHNLSTFENRLSAEHKTIAADEMDEFISTRFDALRQDKIARARTILCGAIVIRTAVANLKGGVGKSSTTLFLAEHWAVFQSRKVLVVDLDPQANASYMLLSRAGVEQAENACRTLPHLFDDALNGRHWNSMNYIVRASDLREINGNNAHGHVSIVPSIPKLWFQQHDFDRDLYQAGEDPVDKLTSILNTFLDDAAQHFHSIPIPLAPSARRKTPLDQRHDASIGETHRRHLSC